MIISIQQTLHGYLNGHQLLANSTALSGSAGKLLLFQSDLSGTLSNTNFESYITGYPIKTDGFYAFARTWYAPEMKRPGCVWTHTLLIKISDLGKIPELITLTQLFKRPMIGQFHEYNFPIDLEFDSLLKSSELILNSSINEALYDNVYGNADTGIIVPASSPQSIENDIINLWSNQWPRLRRNFYFCSGALSLKLINNKIFDLQVIPNEILKAISRSEYSLQIFNDHFAENEWLKILKVSKKNELRKFLWSYGSDVEGIRANFIPLIELFKGVYLDNDFTQVDNIIRSNFSNPKHAKLLKSKIYGEDGLISYPESEKQIVIYLITTKDIEFIGDIELNLERRLINLLQNAKIQISDLLELMAICPQGRLSEHLLDDIEVTDSLLIDLVAKNQDVVLPLLLKSENLIYNPSIWRLPIERQRQLFTQFYNRNLIGDWERLTLTVLEALSDIIFELYWKKGEIVFNASLDWYNQGKVYQDFTETWKNFVTKEKDYLFIKWLKNNERRIHSKTFALIFNNLPSKKIIHLNFNHNTWLTAYKKLKLTEYNGNIPYVASILLTIGFNNDIANSEWLVSVTFQDVYDFAANLKIDDKLWSLIPKDFEDYSDDEDMGVFESIISLIKNRPKRKYKVDWWDYCENLIRTFCHKTIKNNWNPGAFLATLKNQESFYRAIDYCLTFKKGRQLIEKVLRHIENKQIQFEPFQYQYLRKIKQFN